MLKKIYVPSGEHRVLCDSMQSGYIEWHLQPESRLTLIHTDQTHRNDQIDITVNFYMERASMVHYHPILSGSGSYQFTITAQVGIDAHLHVAGAYALDAQQHCSISTRQEHQGSSSKSVLILNGIADQQAVINYTGAIVINENAVKSDAFQENKTMLLGSRASAISIPSLEVHTNDVQCGHGSAVGPLQEDQLLYAQSRGLSVEEARTLLFNSFFQKTLHDVEDDDLRNDIVGKLVAKAMMQRK